MSDDVGAVRPAYLRRAPRWYDGIARLFDLGGRTRPRVPIQSDAEAIAEDWRMVQEDMRRALDAMWGTAR